MQADLKQKQHLTAWVTGVISELSMAFELRRQINLLFPGPNGPNTAECPVSREALSEEAQKRNQLVNRFQDILDQARCDNAFSKLCLPLSNFYYPSDKRQTATSTEEMLKAEANLDRFWAGVDCYFVKKTGETLDGLVKEKITTSDLKPTALSVAPQAASNESLAKSNKKITGEVDVFILGTTL